MNPFSIPNPLSFPDNNPARKFKKWGLTFFLNSCFWGFSREYAVSSGSKQDWLNEGGELGREISAKYPLDWLGAKEYF